MSAEELAQQAVDRIREIVTEAEHRAEEIIRAAEDEAAQIKQRAEQEASETRKKLERARQALSELGGETSEPPAPPAPAPDPEPPAPPEPGPQMASGNSGGGDDAAARLVAMKLAVDGRSREEIEAELTGKFGSGDRSNLIDDVLARAGK